MRTEAETIQKLRDYAESVLTTLEKDSAGADSELQAVLQEIEQKAKQTIQRAGSPLKIGIVGDFSAGKTLLLGALVGYADALPVSELPTTGNVTVLRFKPKAQAQETQVGPFRIEFLDRSAAIECLRELLRAALARSQNAGVRGEAVDKLKDLQARVESTPWTEVESWCRSVWPHGGANPNPALRHLLREMVWFVRCCGSPLGQTCLDAVADAERIVEVSAQAAGQGLRLMLPSTPVTSMRFDELPQAPAVGAHPGQLTPDVLRGLFPLIYRIAVDIQLPQRIWDLADLRGAGEFILLDFPGLGAADSGVRDEYLCKRELREVQTILILLDGRNPGGSTGQQLFDMMQKDRPEEDLRDNILVGVNRFDQLPLQQDGGEAVLSRLVAADELAPAGPLNDNTVLEQLPILQKCVNDARTLTPHRDDRTVFLSALGALRELRSNTPANVRIGSPEFEGNLTSTIESQLRQPKWRRLAQLLSESNSRSPLARWVGDYARDCGIGRLRQLIVEHVAQHGLQQLFRYVNESAQELRRAIGKLPERRREGTGAEYLSANDLQRIVDELYSIYTSLKSEHEQSAPELTVTAAGQRIGLQHYIHDHVTQSVTDWEVWNELLNRIDKDGVIRHVEQTEDPWGDDDEDDQSGKLPEDSRWFLSLFEATVRENEKFAMDCVQDAVRNQLQAYAQRTQPCRDLLAQLLADAAVQERIRDLHENTKKEKGRSTVQRQWNTLNWAVQPASDSVSSRFLDGYAKMHGEPVDAAAGFPLAGADPHGPAQQFPWSNGHKHNGGNHQVLIMRLRDALADGMRRCVMRQVSQLNKQVLNGFLDTFTNWIEGLLRLGGNYRLLTYISGEQSADSDSTVWQAAAIPYPLEEAIVS